MGICASDRKEEEDKKLAETIVDLNFKQYDTNKDGVLSKEEMKIYCQNTAEELKKRGIKIADLPATDEELLKIIDTYDINKDGNISKDEMKLFILNTMTVGWVDYNKAKSIKK